MDLKRLRHHLEQERMRLTEKLEQMKTQHHSINEKEGSWFGDRDEQSNEATELRRRLHAEENLRDLLAMVEHALHKFDAGTYGLCDSCGQPIGAARLQALPHANLCLNCKTLRKGR